MQKSFFRAIYIPKPQSKNYCNRHPLLEIMPATSFGVPIFWGRAPYLPYIGPTFSLCYKAYISVIDPYTLELPGWQAYDDKIRSWVLFNIK